MNLEEYNKIENLNYDEYCNYLKNKYGEVKGNYFLTESCKSKNSKITRTNEGLFIHHIKEDRKIKLSEYSFAIMSPFEYQIGENLVYCDYLEHLLLHILICEKVMNEAKSRCCKLINIFCHYQCQPGIRGIVNFIVPQLNDLYNQGIGLDTKWRKNCFDKIKDDRNCYIELIKRYKENIEPYYLIGA